MFTIMLPRLFSFSGRLPRSRFWLGSFLLGCAFLALMFMFERAFGRSSSLVIYPLLFWLAAALAVKRLHDRGRSLWSLLALLIPVLGPLWLAIELGVRRGVRGENQYGQDPLELPFDYLTVK
jgi:uncharacterized membrane protein YhaH (DUF805 family)